MHHRAEIDTVDWINDRAERIECRVAQRVWFPVLLLTHRTEDNTVGAALYSFPLQGGTTPFMRA